MPANTCAIRRLPCNCEACYEQIKKPWDPSLEIKDQPKFQPPTDTCFFGPVMDELNKWHFVEFRPKKTEAVQEEVEALHENAYAHWEALLEQKIEVDNLGAVTTDDRHADGYHVVQWTSQAYTLQTEELVEDCGLQQPGTVVAKGKYLNLIRYCKQWYDKTVEREAEHLFLLRNVLEPELLTVGASQYRKPLAAPVGIPMENQRWVPDTIHNRLLIDKGAWKKMDLVEMEPQWSLWAEETKKAAVDKAKAKETQAENLQKRKRAARMKRLTGNGK
jgi:hypothetical protein